MPDANVTLLITSGTMTVRATITHDVSVAEALSGKCMVLKNGKLVETGDTRKILFSPSSNYTKLYCVGFATPMPQQKNA